MINKIDKHMARLTKKKNRKDSKSKIKNKFKQTPQKYKGLCNNTMKGYMS